METVSQYLKKKCQDAHRGIETSQWSKNIISPELTFMEYIDWLRRFQVFVKHCELVISQTKVLHGALVNPMNRNELIIQDLEGYQLLPSSDSSVFTTGNGWCCLYLLEGSQLGGTLISKVLSRNQLIPPCRTNYFNFRLRERVKRWVQVSNWIDQQNGIDRKSLAKTIISTFTQLDGWMSKEMGHANTTSVNSLSLF